MFSREVSSLGRSFLIKSTLVKTKQMTQPGMIILRKNAKNKQVNIWTLPSSFCSCIARETPENHYLFPVLTTEPTYWKTEWQQSGLSIWPYCFHPLISLVLTVLMRKQMHEAANYLHLASEWKKKKTQHLIVSFELGRFKSNKVEIFKKGTLLLKTCFLFI